MPEENHILFFDLEVNPKNGEILKIGALLNGSPFSGAGLPAFQHFARPARLLCGHNIFDHDLPVLKAAEAASWLFDKPAIDTLRWSALLFPKKPYHHLVKDYQLAGVHLNNPLADAQLSKELLGDLLAAFHDLPARLKTVYVGLLREAPEFRGFFQLVKADFLPEPITGPMLAEYFQRHFSDQYCSRAELEKMIAQQPVELAYAVALISTNDPSSLPPPWLLHRYPEVQRVVNRLRAACDGKGNCPYCEHLQPRQGLRRFFGFDDFRRFEGDDEVPLQQQVVEAALAGKSLLAVFPTGGGKSLTFQLPALIKGVANHSLTIVISPLQSLMKDQVDVLQQRHDITTAVTINGLLSPLERSEALERVREGGANLLYIAPESLRSNSIFNLLRGRQINRFVIDEAHCFSSWGQDFRVDYLYIGPFIRKLREAKNLEAPIPVSCFTATAKPAVIEDIQAYFRRELDLELHVFQTHAGRKNLAYFVEKVNGPEEKFEKLIDLLQLEEGAKIIYVARVKTAESLAFQLQQYRLKARAYHGQLDRDVKIQIQDEFMREDSELEIIVATSAFGMGVDKDDVKIVIHYDISDSLENYLQESGRAGRNPSLRAQCFILFDENDLHEHFSLLNATKLSQKEIYQIWQGIKRFKKQTFTKSALEIAKQAGWDTEMYQLETRVKVAIAALEDAGYVRREENAPRIFAQSIRVKNVEEANRKIDLHAQYFDGESEITAAKRIFSSLISRARTGMDTQVDVMAESLGLEKSAAAHILNVLKQIQLLSDDKDLTAYFYTGTGAKHSTQIYKELAEVEKFLFERLFPKPEVTEVRIFLRELNEALNEEAQTGDLLSIRNILNYWRVVNYIEKERIDHTHDQYRIRRKVDLEVFRSQMEERIAAAGWCLQVFQNFYLPAADQDQDFKNKKLLAFSITGLKKQMEEWMPKEYPIRFYEHLLLYLHHIHAIELKSGLLVFYNPMKIVRKINHTRKQYTQDDYEKLGRYYQSKTEQIHIVGEYARKQLQYNEEAKQFVDDYFTLPYAGFLDKYFQNRKGKIKQPITEEKFQEIIGNLSTEQLKVVKDNKSNRILVAAGPGSGKTRVLVHKVASLLMMEDVKPEQFLMLTFSRPAALDFKYRLRKLVGKTAYFIDIFTFHGFAFQLAGRIGNLERAQDILPKLTAMIIAEEIPLDRIRNKSVIVIDEYQDVSEEEYRFIMAIIEKAEKIRVVAVGDDDQNIYEFRGASVQYMRDFVRRGAAQVYFLTTNYRARPNLLQLTNHYINTHLGANRLKHHIPLIPHRTENGRIEIIRYDSRHLIEPLLAQVQRERPRGTAAILTKTNEEAVLLATLLKQRDIPARLISDKDGFVLRDLLELRYFTHHIFHSIQDDFGLITEEAWAGGRQLAQATFRQSLNLDLLERVLDAYEKGHPKKFKSTWNSFLRESRIEDFYHPEKNTVLVSTMHKAKGKEFDQVFLLLDRYPLQTEEKRRVLYVALTRAKDHLFIHTNRPLFPLPDIPGLVYQTDRREWAPPDTIVLQCGLSDVWLGFFKRPAVVRAIQALDSGVQLKLKPGQTAIFQDDEEREVLWLSKTFEQKLEHYLEQDYALQNISARYIVVWQDLEEGKYYRVVLPELTLKKNLE
jgi:ATP-dependent DNA helicase RecQ